jgi:DNA modification methylase
MLEAPELTVTYLPIDKLKPFPRNARTHTAKQIHQILASIREFGFTNPIIVDESNTIICGHGRVEAAKLLNYSSVPAIRITDLSDSQKRAYVLADNKLALNSGWDPEILAIEFQYLAESELSFEIEITGFDTAEIDILIDGPSKKSSDDSADHVPAPASFSVTRLGDIWNLGKHKIVCGDARNPDLYPALLETPARLVFADPPYNVPIDGHVCGLGAVKHREFAMAVGEMSPPEFMEFLTLVFRHAAHHSMDGALHYICMDWRSIAEVSAMGKIVYSELKNLCIWNKNNGGMGSFYRSKHELVFVFKVGKHPHLNTIELGRNGRYRTNVWDYDTVDSRRPRQSSDPLSHPTIKPVALVIDAIKDCSRRGEIVLDPFGGSGTTIIAVEKSRRRARVIEIDPIYVDVAIRRWQNLTGGAAILVSNGLSFSEVARSRYGQEPENVTDIKTGGASNEL